VKASTPALVQEMNLAEFSQLLPLPAQTKKKGG